MSIPRADNREIEPEAASDDWEHVRVNAQAWQMTVKRTFDILVASLALLILAPLLLTVAILIKVDSKGPVLF